MRGKLFTQDFLGEGIAGTAAWRALGEPEVDRFAGELRRVLAAFPTAGSPNEATTEQDLIYPVLEALGWEHFLPQQTTSGFGRTDVPDLLLFADEAAKHAAQAQSQDQERFRHGVAVLEAKRWGRPLDRGEARERLAEGAPSTQMLRYLSRAELVSDGAIRWGILTNGHLWRLYWQGARSRSEEFLELDLAVVAGAASATALETKAVQPVLDRADAARRRHLLRVFCLLFRRASFLPQRDDPERRTFHAMALEESRRWEEKVSTDLGRVVFDTVFPGLLESLLQHDPQAPARPGREYLDELRRAALTFLYRLLFIFYAEDRNLLPAGEPRYDDYSLRKIRDELERRLDGRDALSERAGHYYNHLQDLFAAVGEGDPAIGLPPYDGGLFEPAGQPLLERTRIPDRELAPLLDALSRREEAGRRRWINYRDLSVQHLGSIYERLLEFEPVVEDDGSVALRPNPFARKTSGSYYTHDDLGRLILERSVGPLVREIRDEFDDANRRLASDRRPKPPRLAELARSDAAARILDLKICDPAMGSGHFLVSPLLGRAMGGVLDVLQAGHAESRNSPRNQGRQQTFLAPGLTSRTAPEPKNQLILRATASAKLGLNRTIDRGCRVLLVHPKAVQTGLNNLTAFQPAIWYEGPDYDARVTRQANGRPHRIGQTEPVRLIYPYSGETLQKTALDLVARKITASLQVDGLSLAGALEAAGTLSDED
jgi:hypothetical protein